MKLFGFEITRATVKQAPFEDALMRLVAAQEGYWTAPYGIITPENCMMAPTVQAIVTAVSRRISVSPCDVMRRMQVKTETDTTSELDLSLSRTRSEILPNHPVAQLLNDPNNWQDRVSYWTDAVSRYLRYGNYYAYTSRGATGPIRSLIPLHPQQVTVQQNLETWVLTYMFNGRDVPVNRMHHVRGASRNGYHGDSPIIDIGNSIALEIAAEQFGNSFFRNGALPLLIFRYAQGMQAFKNAEDERQFINDYQNAVGGSKRHRALLLPKGIDVGDPVEIQNDKAQFLETRRYQRTVIAGAFGVPPHLVGDLERATFNNVEQQSADFTINVVMPVARCFEAAMERDLLTQQDRNSGVVIRFNLDAAQRADFKSRQEGLKIQREAGVIAPNDWREAEGMNPIPDEDGGEDYIRPLNYVVAGEEPPAPAQPARGNGAAPPEKPAAQDAMKELLLSLARTRQEVTEGMELAERMANRDRPTNITVNMPEMPAPIVHFRPEINVSAPPVHVDAPITVEGTRVQIDQHAAEPMDIVPVRGTDGRVQALEHRPAKKAG